MFIIENIETINLDAHPITQSKKSEITCTIEGLINTLCQNTTAQPFLILPHMALFLHNPHSTVHRSPIVAPPWSPAASLMDRGTASSLPSWIPPWTTLLAAGAHAKAQSMRLWRSSQLASKFSRRLGLWSSDGLPGPWCLRELRDAPASIALPRKWRGCVRDELCDDLNGCCRDYDHYIDKKGNLSCPI
jgi:hypothetical protein